MLGLVRLELYTCLGSYSIYPCIQWVNDKYLSAIVPYMPDRGVVRGSDSSIDSVDAKADLQTQRANTRFKR